MATPGRADSGSKTISLFIARCSRVATSTNSVSRALVSSRVRRCRNPAPNSQTLVTWSVTAYSSRRCAPSPGGSTPRRAAAVISAGVRAIQTSPPRLETWAMVTNADAAGDVWTVMRSPVRRYVGVLNGSGLCFRRKLPLCGFGCWWCTTGIGGTLR